MSKTKRCIDCPPGREQWEDEVCVSCGRCKEHCQKPHVLLFDPKAMASDDRPHPEAGKRVVVDVFQTGPEDTDRARATV